MLCILRDKAGCKASREIEHPASARPPQGRLTWLSITVEYTSSSEISETSPQQAHNTRRPEPSTSEAGRKAELISEQRQGTACNKPFERVVFVGTEQRYAQKLKKRYQKTSGVMHTCTRSHRASEQNNAQSLLPRLRRPGSIDRLREAKHQVGRGVG